MRMGHKRLRFVGLIAVAMVLVVACGSSGGGTPAKTFKIGLVTDTGGLNDKSFNHLADVGLEKAKTDFKIQGDVKESKTGADYIPNLTDFASKNYDLVIGVGFLMQQAVGTVSGTFPNIHFAIIDGAGTDANGVDLKHSNVVSLFFKEQDAGAMVGAMAGWLEKNGKSKKNQPVIGAAPAVRAGAVAVARPEQPAPSVIATALNKVDVATYTAIHNVVQGQFQGGALTFSIANEGAGYAVDNFDLPADLKAELDKVQGQIKSGALTPPADIPA